MNETKEKDTKASSVIAVPDGGGATEKSTGGAAEEGVIGATATGTKDTAATVGAPSGGFSFDIASLEKEAELLKSSSHGNGGEGDDANAEKNKPAPTVWAGYMYGPAELGGSSRGGLGANVCADGGVEVQKEAVTAVANEDGTPATKKQKVAGEVTPPDAKETKMCEVCAKRELKAGEIPNKCDRCGKTAVCDYCINACSKCSKCNDSICDMCCFGDWRTRDWHNELTYCELCGERRCGKCGGDDFALLCEDSSKGMVCRECDDVRREEAEMGYF